MSELILHLGTPTKDDPNYYLRWESIGQVTTDCESKPTIVYGDWRTDWNKIDWQWVKLVVLPSTGTEYYPRRSINASNDLPVISLKNAPILKEIRGVSEWCLLRMLYFAEIKGLNISSSKILLIGGLGRIGTHLTEVLRRMRANVDLFDIGSSNIEKKIERADIISIHLPLEKNKGFYNKKLLHLTKGKILINSSRKEIIGEEVDATEIYYAHDFGVDKKSMLSTPHIAGSKTQDRILTDEWLVKEVKSYLQQPAKTPTEKQL